MGCHDEDADRPRLSLDPDDYRGGFGLWSGTSFAAPLLAGHLARALLCEREGANEVDLDRLVSDVLAEHTREPAEVDGRGTP